MRHLPILGLLLTLPILVGCDTQNPAGATGDPTPATRIPEGLDERHAANFLAMAKDFQKVGDAKQAVATLKELLNGYPETDAADEAKKMLADLDEDNDSAAELEDGGAVPNTGRDKAQEFLSKLANVGSVEEEKKLVTEFGAWLRENEYKIQVSMIDGKRRLSCPFFPPETPWVDHSFLADEHLELLPRLDVD